MLTNRRVVRIEWGDCDPAGIVYYPRYFAIFDGSTTALIEQALGMSKYVLVRRYGCVGYPIVATRARFIVPTRYGDDVVVETTVAEIGRSSFSVEHRLFKDGALAAEGFETRVWAGRDPRDPDRITSTPIPTAVVECLSTPEGDVPGDGLRSAAGRSQPRGGDDGQ
jgi:4-hydroxybenzoyl-CoA thioesterase